MGNLSPDVLVRLLKPYFISRAETNRQDWTPTVTQSGSVTFTITHAHYSVIVNTVHLRARLAITGSGTGGNSVSIGGLPFTPLYDTGIIGTIMIIDAGTAFYVGALLFGSSSSLVGRAHGLGNNIGIAPNFALANGDTIDLVGTYERA